MEKEKKPGVLSILKSFGRFNVFPRLQLYFSLKDVFYSLLSSPSSEEAEQYVKEIQSYWNTKKEVLVTYTVRTSLDLLLQALQFPAGDEVLMSAINILDMVEIVERHGLVPIPIDVDINTLAPSPEKLENLISDKCRIFIIAHLCGSVIDVSPYIEICKKHGILVVEDCAQAFSANRYNGAEEADVSFFSFGPMKYNTAFGGACAIIRDKSIAQKMKEIERHYPLFDDSRFIKRIFKYVVLKVTLIPWIYSVLQNISRVLGKEDAESLLFSQRRVLCRGDIFSQIRYRPPKRMISLLRHRLRTSGDSCFEKRQRTAKVLISLLKPEIIRPTSQARNHTFWAFPIVLPNAEGIYERLRENGFGATRAISGGIQLIDPHGSVDTSLEVFPLKAEYFIKHFIDIPLPEAISEKRLKQMAEIINSSVV